MIPSTVPRTSAVGALGASWVFLPADGQWPTVLAFLCAKFPHIAAQEWQARMAEGLVCTEAGEPLYPASPYLATQRIRYFRRVDNEVRVPFEVRVLHQDAHIVVADKPHFLPVTPSGRYAQETVLARLRQQLGIDSLAPMHRLDRDTAGLVLLSVQPATRGAYHGLFMNRTVSKTYEAIAPWRADVVMPQERSTRLEDAQHFMQVHEVAGEPNAHSRLALLGHNGRWGRYELQPLTGRRHQLRVHMAALGLPILYDGIYPHLSPELPLGQTPDYTRPMQLLAKRLAFKDPISGENRTFVSERSLLPLPEPRD